MSVPTVVVMSTPRNKEGMLKNHLHITFEGPRVSEDGLALEDLQKTLTHVQKAMRHMVAHLSGDVASGRGRPPRLVREQSGLRLARTSPGSLVAELELRARSGAQGHLVDYGARAVRSILDWRGRQDPSLPQSVIKELLAVRGDLSEDIDCIRLGSPDADGTLTLTRMQHARERAASEELEATLQGRLMMVDWNRRTARLDNYGEDYVRLRLDAGLDGEMQRLATQYVEVKGRGRFPADGTRVDFHVEHVNGTRSWTQPADLHELLNDPDPKTFDPEHVVRASDPFDVDDFMRAIREGRDA